MLNKILFKIICIGLIFAQFFPLFAASTDEWFSVQEQLQIEKFTNKFENEAQEKAMFHRNKIIQLIRDKIWMIDNVKAKNMLEQIIKNLEGNNLIRENIAWTKINTSSGVSWEINITQNSLGTSLTQTWWIADKNFYFVVSIYLDGKDEKATTVEEMETMRSQLAKIDKNLRVSWAMTNVFVFHESNRPQLAKVLEMVDKYHDEISFWYGFPNNQYTITSFKGQIMEWLYRFRYNALNKFHVGGTMNDYKNVFRSIPEKYRPTSVTTYAINPEQAQWVRDNLWIDTFMGWTATQYHVDQLSWEGSPLMPYWSDKNNPLVPAQNDAVNSKAIFMNTITVDPIGSTYIDGQSRWTIHPADPLTGWRSQLYTIKQYLTNPYKDKNNINYISLFIDINWILRDQILKSDWENIITLWPKDVPVKIVWPKEFAEQFKKTVWNNNDTARFSLLFRGSGEQRVGFVSDSSIQYFWTETKTERIILKKQDDETIWKIIDFTDYAKLPIPILQYTTKGNEENVSYITGRNFKLAPYASLTDDEKKRIKEHLQNIGFKERVDFTE